MKKIACIIVTFNRKALLIKCLDSVNNQTYKPHTVYIIDNASTDGTRQLVADMGFDSTIVNDIKFQYVLLPENIGGSGGFYTGFKTAFESEERFDAFWVMDDDGIADKDQLNELVSYIDQYGYVSPNVRAIDDPSVGAFFTPPADQKVDEYGNYLGVANPFNGVIFSRELVNKVGFPEKNMFIWGDEINYNNRCLSHGYKPIMIKSAIHFHPLNRQIRKETWCGRTIVLPDVDWKLYCFARNRVYNSLVSNGLLKAICRSLSDLFDFLFALRKQKQIPRMKVVIVALRDGLLKDLTKSRKFI